MYDTIVTRVVFMKTTQVFDSGLRYTLARAIAVACSSLLQVMSTMSKTLEEPEADRARQEDLAEDTDLFGDKSSFVVESRRGRREKAPTRGVR